MDAIECACGCGEMRPEFDSQNRSRKFINGHHNKKSNHYNWKGGRCIDSYHGYVLVSQPDHHSANKQGYVLEHRLVWERHNNASLLPWGDVHHKNGNRADNRIENLNAMMHADHISLHNEWRILMP